MYAYASSPTIPAYLLLSDEVCELSVKEHVYDPNSVDAIGQKTTMINVLGNMDKHDLVEMILGFVENADEGY